MNSFRLPDLGEGLQEAEIVAWHVGEGDHVAADQPLVSVETEKAVVEIPSPRSGHVGKLRARVGERVKVGAPLLDFEEGAHAEAGTVVGALPPETSVHKAVRASPAVRARARERNVDLASVTPTGPNGAITLADIEAAAAKAGAATIGALRGARRTMAVNMARAWREVAHASLQDEADVDAWPPAEDVTCRLVRAIAAGAAAEPELNASFDPAIPALRPNPRIDLGLAVDSPDGLFVPVVRDVAAMPAADLRRRIEAIKRGIADRSLPPADLRGATITLSNFGSIAGLYAALIVTPPQVAILGAGRISERAVSMGNGPAFHRMLPLSLTFDHRAVSGGVAARFLRAAIADLERPL
jgi:pyruvate dehydrogenase E2 component (dihydrolipoamide acetyltransferase)